MAALPRRHACAFWTDLVDGMCLQKCNAVGERIAIPCRADTPGGLYEKNPIMRRKVLNECLGIGEKLCAYSNGIR